MTDYKHIYNCLNKKEKRKLFRFNMQIYQIAAINGPAEDIEKVKLNIKTFEEKMVKKYDTTKDKTTKRKV